MRTGCLRHFCDGRVGLNVDVGGRSSSSLFDCSLCFLLREGHSSGLHRAGCL